MYNDKGGNANEHSTREAAFGKEFVHAKRIEYNLMLLKGSVASLTVTALLVRFFPPAAATLKQGNLLSSSPQNSISNPDFWLRAIGYLIVQSIAMTVGGMINNPTLTEPK